MAGLRLGVLGGTFDPPHLGHLLLAQYALEQLGLARVRFVPAGDPWRKAGRDISPARDRLAMTRLAIADNDAFVLDDRDVRREGPSYTVDTLRELRDELALGREDIVFLLGEDALADLPHWHEPARIAELARLAVVPREGVALPSLPFDPALLERVTMPYIGISATQLRQRAHDGLSLRYLVPDAVAAYISEQGLYRHV